MKNPVVLETGITYENSYIQYHFKKNGLTDPVTRETLSTNKAIKNKNVRDATKEFIRQYFF